jgi:DNA repair exonuclease SbcCD ATPase subunit
MNFKNICIENFGGITHLETIPKRVNVIIGPNGHGKTTFLKAVKYGLVGSQTRSELIKDGACAAEVSLDIDAYSIRSINNSKGASVYLNGKKTTRKSIVELLQAEYGGTKEAMQFLTSSEVFEKASSSEFTEFLLNSGFIPLNIDIETLLRLVKETEVIDESIEEELKGNFPAMPDKFSLDHIQEINDYYSGKIKAEKKEIDRLSSIISSVDGIDTTSIREPKTIKKEYELLIADEAMIKAYEEITAKRSTALEKLKKLQETYDKYTVTKPNPAEKISAEKVIEQMDSEIKKSIKFISTLNANNSMLEKQLSRLSSNCCPLSEKISCTQDKTEVIEEINTTISGNKDQIELLEQDKEIYEDQLKKAQEVLEAYRNQEKAYTEKINLLKQIDVVKTSIPSAVERPDLDASEIERKKSVLEDELALANRIEAANNERANLILHENDFSKYSILERITSKKGNVKGKILKLLLGRLVKSINDMAAEACPQLTLDLNINSNGNVIIQCKTPSGTQDYGDLSTGEKLLVQFLVMTQINQLSGFKLLVMDNLDKLDEANFEKMLDFLSQPAVAEYYDHVFVATVNHTEFEDVLGKFSDINVINV